MKVKQKSMLNLLILVFFILLIIFIGIITAHKIDRLFAEYTKTHLMVQSDLLSEIISQRFIKEFSDIYYKPEGKLNVYGEDENGKVFDTKEYSGILSTFSGEKSVTFVEDQGLLLTVPEYEKGKVVKVPYRFIPVSDLDSFFNIDYYDGKTKIAILNRHEVFLYTNYGDDLQALLDDFDFIRRRDVIRKELMKSNSTSTMVKYNKKCYYLYVSKIKGANLILAGIIPCKVFTEGIGKIGAMILFVFALLLIMVFISIFFLFREEKNIRDANELEAEKRAAEKASSAKSDFLANMSHEIRTPINSILGLNEMILRECEDQNIRSYAQDIYSAGHGLISIINDILDFSKIEAGKMEIVPVSYEVCSLLNDVTNMVSSRAKSKNLEFVVDIDTKLPSRLTGDKGRIQQILINLLNNAVKYTSEGYVRLSVKQISWKKDVIDLQIEVTDSGIGIKTEDKIKLFNSFQRLDLQRNRNVEGTGLGLAISSKLITAMGGSIDVQSEYGKGSTFTVVIPQQIVDFTPIGNFKDRFEKYKLSQNKNNRTFTAPNAKILIVDDNAMNLHVAKSLLKQTLVQVSLCSSGKECLEMVRKEHFDIIFLDHMMPEMDGLETLKKLKDLDMNRCKDSPVIALTANAIVGVKEMYLKAGFNDYISKPIEGKAFEALVRKYLPEEKVIPVDSDIAMKLTPKNSLSAPEIVAKKIEPESNEKTTTGNNTVEHSETDSQINVSSGIVYCGDDMQTYLEILQVYIDESGENMHKLQIAFENEDYASYAITAHAVKSTSLTVGAEGLSKIAKNQEFAGKEKRIEDLKNGHDYFIDLYRKVIENAIRIEQEK